MVNIQGTNPITGQSIDATSPRTVGRYLIGGAIVVGALVAGKFVADLAGEATGVGQTVEDRVLALT